MAARSEFFISFQSLVLNNGGKFKSEKQAAFLLSKCADGIFVTNQRHVFGEHGGCVRVVEYVFTCDQQGITKATKNGEQYFPKTEKMIAKEAKAEQRAKTRHNDYTQRMDRYEKMIAECNKFNGFMDQFPQIMKRMIEAAPVGDENHVSIPRLIDSMLAKGFFDVYAVANEQAIAVKHIRVAKKLIARFDRIQNKIRAKYYPE